MSVALCDESAPLQWPWARTAAQRRGGGLTTEATAELVHLTITVVAAIRRADLRLLCVVEPLEENTISATQHLHLAPEIQPSDSAAKPSARLLAVDPAQDLDSFGA